MRFKQYLNEGRSVPIDRQHAISIIHDKCKKALKGAINGDVIYRGIRNQYMQFLTVDPTKGRLRISAHTSNHMTLLMDNLPVWKGWPKRSRSLICSSNMSKSSTYGTIFVVLPYNNVKIGMCSGTDIWVSFPYAGMNSWGMAVNDFNQRLQDIGISASNWNVMKKGLMITPDDINSSLIAFPSPKVLRDWVDTGGLLLDYLNKMLDPKKNEFKLIKPGDELYHNVELWVGGPSVLIEYDTWLELIAKEAI